MHSPAGGQDGGQLMGVGTAPGSVVSWDVHEGGVEHGVEPLTQRDEVVTAWTSSSLSIFGKHTGSDSTGQ